MQVKYIFPIALTVAILMMIVAMATLPRENNDCVTLVWATDNNPVRQEQISLFREWHMRRYHELVDVRIDPANYSSNKIIIQSLCGKGPDIFDFIGQEALERFVASGIILDVTDAAREMEFEYTKVWEGVWPCFVSNGRQYGFPANVVNNAIMYHKDLFRERGVPYPEGNWTWEEFVETARKLTFVRPDGMKQYGALMVEPYVLIVQNGCDVFNKSKTRCIIDEPAAVEALNMYLGMMHREKIMPTPSELASQSSSGGWGGGTINVFATKRFAMTMAGRYWFINFEKDARAAAEQGNAGMFDLGIAPYPHLKRTWADVTARCTGISRTGKNILYARRFLQFLATEEYSAQVDQSRDGMSPLVTFRIGQNRPPSFVVFPGLEAADSPVWYESMAYSTVSKASPFISPYMMRRYWYEYKDRFDIGSMGAAEALQGLAHIVNQEIQRQVARRPDLKQRFDDAVATEHADAANAVVSSTLYQ